MSTKQKMLHGVHGLARRGILTQPIYPPIPARDCDWCAYYESTDEPQYYGWGPTEGAAIADLQGNYPLEDLK